MLFRLKDRLKLVGVDVKFPIQNRLNLKIDSTLTYDPAKITEEQMINDLFESIKHSSFHVVSNEIGGLIDLRMAESILLAFDYKKPIVITNKPYFSVDVPLAWRQTIENNLSKVYVTGLLKMNNLDLQNFVDKIANTKVDYLLG
ncbi:MAG TPA: hypothetical protein VLA77_02335 [Candidatus Saccharimonadales bacterium]|nr:hypothetical protein [Candidatus Saccharimonadales bacterium]